MTCKELAALLAQYPNYMPVVIRDADTRLTIVHIHRQVHEGRLELFGLYKEMEFD